MKELYFVIVLALVVLFAATILSVVIITNRNAFSDCVAYGNTPAECAVALD